MFRAVSRTTILLGTVCCSFFSGFRVQGEHAHLEHSITQIDPTLGICSGYFTGDFFSNTCGVLSSVVGVDVVSGATPRSAPRKVQTQTKAPQTKATPQDMQQAPPQAADALTTRCEQEHQQAMRTTCTAAGQQQAPRLSSMFTGLKNLQGRALERAYLEHMIVYRQGEVEMARLIGSKTTWPEMRTFTSNIIISHTRDIKLMKEWLDLWF